MSRPSGATVRERSLVSAVNDVVYDLRREAGLCVHRCASFAMLSASSIEMKPASRLGSFRR